MEQLNFRMVLIMQANFCKDIKMEKENFIKIIKFYMMVNGNRENFKDLANYI